MKYIFQLLVLQQQLGILQAEKNSYWRLNSRASDKKMQYQQSTDHVSHFIDESLAKLSPLPSKRCIYKVPNHLRRENEKAYEPKILSIGPYHHGKDELKAMEESKLRSLKQLLQRRNETSVNKYIVSIRGLEEKARKHYAESTNHNSDDFVKMMLLDGCFIIELFRKFEMTNLRDADDSIFQLCMIQNLLRCDLLLMENQLPFFILFQLFNMTKLDNPKDDIISMSLNYLRYVLPHRVLEVPKAISIPEIKHLLSLVHDSWCSSFAETRIDFGNMEVKWDFINSATELQEFGIQFKMVKRRSLFDINFANGVLEIPPLRVTDTIESPIRNLIAYEQLLPDKYPKYVCDYIAFMDWLISSSKDVKLLRRSGIIQNWMGDDGVVDTMLNRFDKNIMISATPYNYSQVSNDVNKYCGRRTNAWMANLKRNYFNSPWAFVSFLAAGILLFITVTQTVFSVLSYYSSRC